MERSFWGGSVKLFANHNEFYNYSEFKSLVEENLLLFIDKTDDLLIDKYYPKEMDQFVHLLYDIGFIKVFNPISNKYVAYYELASTYINNFEKLKIHGAFSSVLQLNNNI
jgi:hypothetical protein